MHAAVEQTLGLSQAFVHTNNGIVNAKFWQKMRDSAEQQQIVQIISV